MVWQKTIHQSSYDRVTFILINIGLYLRSEHIVPE